MKLYLPKGSSFTDSEKTAWIKKCQKLTEDFNRDSNPQPIPFDVELYNQNKHFFKFDQYITEMWQEHYLQAEHLYCNKGKKFLTDDLIRYAFFFSGGGFWQRQQIPYLESKWSKEDLKKLLYEDVIYWPTITDEIYMSSECLIHHLTHFTSFQEVNDISISEMKSIIEFGGGYGGMCRLARRLTNHKSTHIIIDLPIFSFIQNNYLQNLFGKESVKLILDDKTNIETNKINLIPISNSSALNALRDLSPDLFIATWSLSEANQNTVDLVTNLDYFHSRFLLMGYRHYDGFINPRQPCSDKLAVSKNYTTLMKDKTFYCMDNEQHYYFCKRNPL